MSPKPRRDARDRAEQTTEADRRDAPPPVGRTPRPGRSVVVAPTDHPWEPFARFPLSRLGPEWFGPNWLTNTDWFGHWDHLFPTRWPVPFPPGPTETFRIEEFEDGDDHVIRAEMPGLDPETDITIEVDHDVLSVAATRERRTETTGEVFRSEFSYGTFRRLVRLPPGATADDVTATYDAGVLEIRITRPHRDESTVVSIRVRTIDLRDDDDGAPENDNDNDNDIDER